MVETERQTEIRWDAYGLVPAIVQDARTGQVLMLAYMNKESLGRTLESGETWFWSRSRGELWHKGATSGNTQSVLGIRYDCDADALLVRVEPSGPACHTNRRSCFFRELHTGANASETQHAVDVLGHLETVILDRKANPKQDSYTCQLLDGGESVILKKVGEEAVEVIVAAQNEGDERLVSELADLTYHTLVLLALRGISWGDVEAELARRFA
jgi:phosphoribosyl-ATP pyrophosphohydrolase/phosphoribosyl-AMP cyclohydrolase